MSEADENAAPASGPEEEAGQSQGVLGRWIAVSLAAIAFLGAGIAVLQTDASVNESNTARETTRAAVSALRAGVISEAGILLDLDIDAEASALNREQSFLSRQFGGIEPPLDLAQLRSLLPDGGDLPRAQTKKALERLKFEGEASALSQSALAETRVTWNDRSTQYTTAIAVLAFALFLVGFSLVLGGARRVSFYVLGILIALLVVVATVYIHQLPIPETPEAAITATARGSVASDSGDQEAAQRFFDQAIEEDEDYFEPYSRRAVARALAVNPDFRRTGAIVSSDAELKDSVDDALKALELDDGRSSLALNFLAVIALYAGEFEQSVKAATESISINGQVPDIHLVKSAAEVGLGDNEAALESLDTAGDLLSGSDPSERTRGLFAGYVTDLEQVVNRVPERAPVVNRIERRVIGSETAFTLDRKVSREAPDQGSARVEGLRFSGGKIRLDIRWNDLPAGTALTLIGFERPSPDSGWVQPRELALFRTVSGTGQEAAQGRLDRACKPVEVRVDTYLDGAFVDSAVGPGVRATC